MPGLGLPWNVFTLETGEFWGRFSFLKAGLVYSDYLTTVSPTYAAGNTDARFGAGMEGVLFARRQPVYGHPERHRHRDVESGV